MVFGSKLSSFSQGLNPVVYKNPDTVPLEEYVRRHRAVAVYNDVTIVAGGHRYPANRMVLGTYSNYFHGMFTSEMKEKYEVVIELQDVDHTVIKLIIDYIYEKTIEINMENVCDVLAGADYLQMTDVRKFCFEYLASVLAHDNCFAIRVLADRFLNCEMKQKVDEFIQDNFENTILEEDFKLLSKEQLTYFLLPENRKRSVKEETIYRAVTEWLRYDMKERSCHFDELMRFVKFNELSSSFFLDVVCNDPIMNSPSVNGELLFRTMKEHIALSVQRERRCFLVVGGKDSNDVLKYDTAMKKSTVLTPLNKKRSSACLARVGNYVYSIGGKVIWGSEVTDMVERLCYDDVSSSWENMASMNEKRCVAGAATIHDTIFVTGGVNETPVELSSAEYYNLAFDKWTPIARMNHTRGAHVVVAVDNCLYSGAGHCDRTYLSSMERYDPRVGTWELVAPMEKGRRWPTATVVDGLIYVIGGDIGVRTDTRTVEIYDQRANAWFPGPGLIIDRSAAASCTVRGKIYVLGGVEENVTDTSVECYDPATEKWTAETNLPCFMLNHVSMVTV